MHHSSLARTQVPKIGGAVRTRTMQTHKTWPTWLPTFGAFALLPPKAARSPCSGSLDRAGPWRRWGFFGRTDAEAPTPVFSNARASHFEERADPTQALSGENGLDPTSWSRPKGAMPFFGKVLHPVRTLPKGRMTRTHTKGETLKRAPQARKFW